MPGCSSWRWGYPSPDRRSGDVAGKLHPLRAQRDFYLSVHGHLDHCNFSLYILIQFLILGRDLQPARVLQLICTTLFGYFTDFTNFLADRFLPDPASLPLSPAGIYGVRLLYLAISMALIALGILLYLAPCLISLPGEGIMQVIADKLHLPLHTVKMCFDITVSLIALAISLAYFRQFHGIREGTVIAAFGVGKILGLYEPLKPRVHRFMYGREAA